MGTTGTSSKHFVYIVYRLHNPSRTLFVRFGAKIVPLFFCVRAISFSISEIFSRIPMVATFGARQNSRQLIHSNNFVWPSKPNVKVKELRKKLKRKIEKKYRNEKYAGKMCVNVCDCRRQKPSSTSKCQNATNTGFHFSG